MLEIVIKIFCAIIYAFLDFYIMKKMLLSDEKIYNRKNIFLLSLIAASYIFLYSDNYSLQTILLKFIFGVVINCIIFSTPLYKTIVAYIIYMMLMLIADIFNTAIYMQFVSANMIRTNSLLMLLTNCTVAITLYLIIKLKCLTKKLQDLVSTLKKDSNFQTIIFYILIYILLINLFYKIISVYEINYQTIINYIIVITSFIVLIIYTANVLDYSNLVKEYDILFNYVQQFEDGIDNMDLNNHENKNQLAILKSYILDKSYKNALDLIEDMTKESYKQDSKIISELKNIPKGGIKGLLYYKILIAKNKKINLSLDISKTVPNKIKKLTLEQIKILCRLIGIYLDNAIDAACETKNKLLSIEVYSIDDNLEFVFSNNYKQKNMVDINKFGKRGYTTKGDGHGRGLYLSKKLLSKNSWIISETKLINKMYVQKIIIKDK